eukprot:6187894-Alexandrium_andersonii.AAC.1
MQHNSRRFIRPLSLPFLFKANFCRSASWPSSAPGPCPPRAEATGMGDRRALGGSGRNDFAAGEEAAGCLPAISP